MGIAALSKVTGLRQRSRSFLNRGGIRSRERHRSARLIHLCLNAFDRADGFLGAGIGGLFLAVWAVARYTSRRLPQRLQRRVLAGEPVR